MKPIALYFRISTDEQSHASQAEAVGAALDRHPLGHLPRAVFRDTLSGSLSDREGLSALLSAARAGELAAVAVFKLDRLGRSMRHLADLIAEFRELGIPLIATSQGIDTSNAVDATSTLMLNILASFAEFERDMIRDRTRAGIAAARARGSRIGRPCGPDLAPDVLDEIRSRLRANGSVREIASRMGLSRRRVSALAKDI